MYLTTHDSLAEVYLNSGEGMSYPSSLVPAVRST